MTRVRLKVEHSTGFSVDLWGWSVKVTQADSGRVETVWKTSSCEPRAEFEHRQRARVLPEWCSQTLRALHAIEFDKLPPSATWDSVVDDVGFLSVTYELDQKRSEFSIFWAPSLWPSLPGATRDAIEQVVAILEPIARKLHEP